MKSKAAASRPCFECSLDADRYNRNPQFVRQNRRASLELRNVAIDGTRTLGKNQQNSAVFESNSADLHCANEVDVGIDRNNIAHLCKPPRKRALPVIAITVYEYVVKDTARENRDKQRTVQKRFVIWANQKRQCSG